MTPRIASLLLLLLFPAAVPDEGQWLPSQFLARDWGPLRERGLEISKEELWHPEKGGILSAAVQINGCSAAFVSGDGLLVTNHHCGFGAIQRLSSVEDNYVEEGFVAPERSAEPVCPGMVVSVIRRIEDVTGPIHEAQAGAEDDAQRYELVQKARARLIREAEEENPGTKCSIASFFSGREYRMYYRTRIPDVRLVYAPPRSIGEFGGEEDNWMWPRHTGDFAFFRAYVAPDGSPAQPSEDNVPYEPEHWLQVSGEGVREGDLALILGYPGSTERYLTSPLVAAREELTYPLRLRLMSGTLEILRDVAEGDPERALALSSRIKSLANVEKNARGMIAGLARNRTVERKRREEAAFKRWVQASEEREERWGGLLEEVMALDREEAATAGKDTVLIHLWNHVPLVTQLMQTAYLLQEEAAPADERDPRYGERMRRRMQVVLPNPALTGDLETVQEPVLALVLDVARDLPPEQRIPALDALAGDMTGAEAAEAALETTELLEPGARVELLQRKAAELETDDDPLVRLAAGLAEELRAMRLRNRNRAGARLLVGRRWIEAQEAWRGQDFYPDANGTLRISVATVKGYEPRDGVRYTPFTTVAGVLDKERGEAPFASPQALTDAAESRDKSRFFDKSVGDVPVCFLTDGDTTGGNSGSPVLNGRGELVGLNFDRVFENVSGDYGWNPARSRNISVDIRYVLWNLESVIPAPHLLQEMGL